jgi:hypothetical protein
MNHQGSPHSFTTSGWSHGLADTFSVGHFQ